MNEFNDLIEAFAQNGDEEYRARYEREKRELQRTARQLDTSHSSIVVDWHCEGSGNFFDRKRGKVDVEVEVTLMRIPSPDEVSLYLTESQIISGNGNSNPSYIIKTSGQPELAVFEGRSESLALGCPEIRDAWGVTDRRGVSLEEFNRVANANPVVADLHCDGRIQYISLPDEGPQLLLIPHRDSQMCRHYINSANFPIALQSGNVQSLDGPTFRATHPCRGNDFQSIE
ncbi:MAG: hypothetical protein AAGD25_26055 [Cyanobacteria bacterium P01_F01_bin.150]